MREETEVSRRVEFGGVSQSSGSYGRQQPDRRQSNEIVTRMRNLAASLYNLQDNARFEAINGYAESAFLHCPFVAISKHNQFDCSFGVNILSIETLWCTFPSPSALTRFKLSPSP